MTTNIATARIESAYAAACTVVRADLEKHGDDPACVGNPVVQKFAWDNYTDQVRRRVAVLSPEDIAQVTDDMLQAVAEMWIKRELVNVARAVYAA